MKERKGLVPVLLVVAACVWGWNFWRLFQQQAQPLARSEQLPEIPQDLLDEVFAATLPDLSRDPFVAGPMVAPKPAVARAPAPAQAPVQPPRLRLLLVTFDGDRVQALVVLPDGSERMFKQGDTYEDWQVTEIEMEGVVLSHKDGNTHSLRILE